MTLNERQQRAVLQAVLAAFTYGSPLFTSQIHLFLPTSADSLSLFRLSKHVDLFYSHMISTVTHGLCIGVITDTLVITELRGVRVVQIP